MIFLGMSFPAELFACLAGRGEGAQLTNHAAPATNSELRSREFFTPAGVDKLIEFEPGHRDATTIMVCYGHDFRASELVDL
jgi:hypothetical protein